MWGFVRSTVRYAIPIDFLRNGVWVPLVTVPIFDAAGKAYATGGIWTDITERKRTEAARALLAAVVEFSDDAIITKTLDGIVTSWNAGAEKIFGYSAREMIGQPVSLLIPPEAATKSLTSSLASNAVNRWTTMRRPACEKTGLPLTCP